VIYEGTREVHALMQADYVLGYRADRPTRCELPRSPRETWSDDRDQRPVAGIPQGGGAGRHRERAHDGPGRPAQGRPRGGRSDAGELDGVPIDGTIVIGEGERDEAPMLYIGEKLGLAQARTPGGRQINARFPEIDIAVDPLEGTNLCAVGAPNAMTVLAAAPRAGCSMRPTLHGEDRRRAEVEEGGRPRRPVADNLSAIAKCLDRRIEDLVVVVLDRERHEDSSADPRHGRAHSAHRDGDLSAGIAAAVVGTGVHAVMGTGGAPEGVLTAAAMRCLNGEILARLVIRTAEDEARCAKMGISDLKRVYRSSDLAPGDSIIFAAPASPPARC